MIMAKRQVFYSFHYANDVMRVQQIRNIGMIEDWFRGILTDGILSNLSGLFDSVNTEVVEIATQVGTTPAGWNAGISCL